MNAIVVRPHLDSDDQGKERAWASAVYVHEEIGESNRQESRGHLEGVQETSRKHEYRERLHLTWRIMNE